MVMADIPGLIEGASDGVGLGHEFLRHVERCRLIVHVVDVSGSEYRDPKEDFKTINRELANFSEELSKRDQIVVANKSDIATEEQIEDFRQFVEEQGYPSSASPRPPARESSRLSTPSLRSWMSCRRSSASRSTTFR